jgi:hypothetical protein
MPNITPFPICSLCNKPVSLETSRADEHGNAVHEGCYLLRVSGKKAPTVPKT